jgi:hypothetical protein
VVPHAGLVIPAEIEPSRLSEEFLALARNIDWFTDYLYDFRDLLGNDHLTFPYCSIILEANRDPAVIEDSVPLRDVFGRAIYREGKEPDGSARRSLSDRYIVPFHREIGDSIAAGASFLFEGHSTITARGVGDDQIDIMNYQRSLEDGRRVRFSPDIYVEIYAEELQKRLPEVYVTVNSSEYDGVYGSICAEHSVDSMVPVGGRAPAILQETNQRLYLDEDGIPDLVSLHILRVAFAESLSVMYHKARGGI